MLPDGLTILQDELKSGKDAVILDVEGYGFHTPEPHANWLETLPLIGVWPEYGDPIQPEVRACFDRLQT